MQRGNHETKNMNKIYGFEGEVKHKYDDTVMNLFTEVRFYYDPYDTPCCSSFIPSLLLYPPYPLIPQYIRPNLPS